MTTLILSAALAQAQFAMAVGGTSWDDAQALVTTADGGYALAGYTASFGAGGFDAFLAKADTIGTLQWVRTLGDTSNEIANSLVATQGGGYALAGYTRSYGAGNSDAFLAKYDSTGTTCVGGTASPTVTDLSSLSFVDPNFTVGNPAPTVGTPSPTVTSPTPTETTVCYSFGVTERSPVGATPQLAVRLVRGGLSVSATSPTGVVIYAADGRLVRALTVTGTARVALCAGVYVLRDERGGTLTAVVAR